MRNRLLLLLVFLLPGGLSHAQAVPDSLWNKANAAYMEGHYAEAARGYKAIRAQGLESAKLYLNLGNACYKQGLIGAAVLNYHRALRLAPGDEDVQYNLSIANAYVQDKIDTVPVFFLKRWIQELRGAWPGNTWAILSVLFLVLAVGGTVLYLLSEGLAWRKGGFYSASLSLLLLLFCMGAAHRQKQAALRPHTAIVMSGAAPVKSSPDKGSKDIFVLHEGTPLTVRDSLGGFCKIMIADGKVGWILASAIEMVD